MTNQQLYLAIGIPGALFALNFLTILAGFFWQSKRFEDTRDSTRSEFAAVRSEIGRVEGTLQSGLHRLESTIQSESQRVEGVLGVKIDGLSTCVKALEDQAHTPLVKR